jgi:hypothetical protein
MYMASWTTAVPHVYELHAFADRKIVPAHAVTRRLDLWFYLEQAYVVLDKKILEN